MGHSSRLLRAAGVLVGLLGFAGTGVAAQQGTGTVNGRIVDKATKAGIGGARVDLGNTNRSTFTSGDGHYTLRGVPSGSQVIHVSIIGYGAQSQTVTVTEGGEVTADFALNQAAVSLDVVTVTSTGEQRGRQLGNPISQIKAADVVEQAQPANFADLVSGRASNVQVLPSGGTIGAGARIRIRGLSSVSLSNEPVYYVDGIKVEAGANNSQALSVGTGGQSTARINDINPEDIESVEIVKGPAAATLYGTQAGNGVVRITTKHGAAGKPLWSVYSELGVLNDENNYPNNYFSWGHTLVGDTIKQCLLTSAVGTKPTCALDSLNSFNVLRNAATTPLGTGYRGAVGVQVSGGGERTRYFFSSEYSDDIGVLQMPAAEYARLTAERAADSLPYDQYRPNELKSVTVRTNVQANLTNTTDITVSAGLVQSTARLPQNDNNITGMLGSGLFGKGYSSAFASTLPALPPGAAQGRQWGFFLPGDVFSILTDQDITRLTASAQANWRPTQAITGRATVGLDYTDRMDLQLQQLNQGPNFLTFRQGRRNDNRFQLAHYTVDANVSAVHELTSDVSSRTSVGVQYIKDLSFGVFAQGLQFPPGGQTTGAGAIQTDSESTLESVTLGGYLEEVIGWRDRRFVTAGFRADDNSAFGSSFKAVYYPKIQASWVISEEPFFGQRDWLNALRLRAAYGASGVQPGPIDALRYYQALTYAVNGSDTPALIISAVGNDSLKPERSSELEVGFDADLTQTKTHVEFTYYHKKTTDALVQRLLPPSQGGSTSRFENLGSTLNKGIEGLVGINFDLGRGVTVDATLSGSHNTSKLLTLGANVQPIINGEIRNVPGYPLFGFWDRPILGFQDLNHNGIIEPSEVVVGDTAVFLGSSLPTTEFALNAGITLFHDRVRLGGQLDYRGGYKVNNFTEYFRCTSSAANNCQAINDKTASLADQAAAVAARTLAYGRTAAGYIVDGTFVKLRELSVTYFAPDAWARAFHGNRLSITATGRNLLKWTNYTGIDPEVNGNGQGNTATQGDGPIDFLTAPPLRTFVFRLNVGF
jgi:TonB-linked SusC/RagA family outer membrane protein